MKRHFTATAFIVCDNKVLLLNHRNLSRWMPPGGHVDENETPEDAAKRECKEETGLDVEILAEESPDLFSGGNAEGSMLKKPYAMLLENIPASTERNEPAHQHMDFLFRAKLLDANQTMALEEAAGDELKWFTRAEVEAMGEGEIFANVRAYMLLILLEDKN